MMWIQNLKLDNCGLIPAIAQNAETGAVLMLAWMNQESIRETVETGIAHFWSRSRKKLWKKGETSGNELHVEDIRIDCDRDSLLLRVKPLGPACHTGRASCFFYCADTSDALHMLDEEAPVSSVGILRELSAIIRSRRQSSVESSYTASLLAGRIERIAKKVGEEAFEAALAATTQSDDRLAEETADLLYHLLVLLEARGLALEDACDVLASRRLSDS